MIMWTGPRVISRTIPADHIRTLNRILNRRPLIWDNLSANDYDTHNVFLGPYDGRPRELFNLTAGIFINPNCQYDLNFIPINSFGMWFSAAVISNRDSPSPKKKSSRMPNFSFNPADYDPERSFRECCRLWAEEFKKPNPYNPNRFNPLNFTHTSNTSSNRFNTLTNANPVVNPGPNPGINRLINQGSNPNTSPINNLQNSAGLNNPLINQLNNSINNQDNINDQINNRLDNQLLNFPPNINSKINQSVNNDQNKIINNQITNFPPNPNINPQINPQINNDQNNEQFNNRLNNQLTNFPPNPNINPQINLQNNNEQNYDQINRLNTPENNRLISQLTTPANNPLISLSFTHSIHTLESETSQLSESTNISVDIPPEINTHSSSHIIFNDKLPTQTDICRVASFFYLPGKLGTYAKEFYTMFCLIIQNSNNFWQKKVSARFGHSSSIDSRRSNFKRHCDKINFSIKKILRSPNSNLRSLLSPFLIEIKETIQTMRSYVKYLENKENHPDDNITSEPDYLINHSRFTTEIQKLLPSFIFFDIANDIKIDAPVVVIRPPLDYDIERIETICYGHLINKFGFWDDLRPSKELSNLRYLATFLRCQYEMYVVEDVDNLCGYMIYKTESDINLEEQLENEYNAMLIDNRNVGENVWDSYVKYPIACPNILAEYPMRLSFIFQVGFRKSHIIPRLMEYAMRKMIQLNIRGCHVVVDKFEMIEPSLLKKNGFYLHSNGNFQNHKYYVLDNKLT